MNNRLEKVIDDLDSKGQAQCSSVMFLLDLREFLRVHKEYELSDMLREILVAEGVKVKDYPIEGWLRYVDASKIKYIKLLGGLFKRIKDTKFTAN